MMNNPFDITKAVDFSDQEIHNYWVDISDNGFFEMAKPKSPMPMLILGGKGSGKTHLMRYFSFSLQKLRYSSNVVQGIAREGYLGIYLRCGGLNASRFSGKGLEDATWREIFVYYMELWLGQLLLGIIRDACEGSQELLGVETQLCTEIMSLFDKPPEQPASSLNDVLLLLQKMQKQIDFEINNCAIKKSLDIKIFITRGSFIFQLPKILTRLLPSFRDVLFVYLVDEFENLSEEQQRYINTLLREKQLPCSFKIGARLYGVKTYATFSDKEENKQGSEFELLPLDEHLRKNDKYTDFAYMLIQKRLHEAGYLVNRNDATQPWNKESLAGFFSTYPKSKYYSEETSFIHVKYQKMERPYFQTLRDKLRMGVASRLVIGINSEADIDKVISLLRVDEYPLLEKINIFMLYQDWYKKCNLQDSAQSIHDEGGQPAENKPLSERQTNIFEHWAKDLLAQLLRECGQKQEYIGLDTFIEMSRGLPRNLLIILKHVFRWAIFKDEKPFLGGKISIDAQREGVKEASEWFFRDARMVGKDGVLLRESINRLAEFFKEHRFSDKPTECSLCAFSVAESRVSEEGQHILQLAEKWSLLLPITAGQKDRNARRVDQKYQINSMLAPYWDIPIYRRGAVALSPKEADAIFSPSSISIEEYNRIKAARIAKLTAPEFRQRTMRTEHSGQPELPGI